MESDESGVDTPRGLIHEDPWLVAVIVVMVLTIGISWAVSSGLWSVIPL